MILAYAVLLLLSIGMPFYLKPEIRARITHLTSNKVAALTKVGRNTSNVTEVYHWRTKSYFDPVRQTIAGKIVEGLCKAFPNNVLRSIQPVLKSGLKPHFDSVSACLHDDLLIFSDAPQKIGDQQVFDALSDLPA